MSKNEELMYRILGKLFENDEAPIVCKGALITKLVLAQENFSDVIRETKDIDLNWTGEPPKPEELEALIGNAVKKADPTFNIKYDREYIPGKTTGGITVTNAIGKQILTMDIDIKGVTGQKIYNFEADRIRGVLPTEIFADKIAAISGDKVFRRAKDIVDVFALSSCISVTTDEIYNTSAQTGNEIKAFDGFLNRKDDLQHAYDKLRGVKGKPPFETVYERLRAFLAPFIEHDRTARVWKAETARWEDI
ncbi:MAG: nucleotidyl transferase AbiEii/AbiGii toxin family protein [Ruminococcus sp.]|jgi:hypothetical protein|nr:nucleotidyl transferase AbiEii/AbiGii toxin family protein [Ruminococcus sp.]